jgi:hypothetical protein
MPMIDSVRRRHLSLVGQTPPGSCCDERTLVDGGTGTGVSPTAGWRARLDPANALVLEILRRWQALALDPDHRAAANRRSTA